MSSCVVTVGEALLINKGKTEGLRRAINLIEDYIADQAEPLDELVQRLDILKEELEELD